MRSGKLAMVGGCTALESDGFAVLESGLLSQPLESDGFAVLESGLLSQPLESDGFAVLESGLLLQPLESDGFAVLESGLLSQLGQRPLRSPWKATDSSTWTAAASRP